MSTSSDQQRTVTMQSPQALSEAMKAQAKQHRRSFTGAVVWALERYIGERVREDKAQA
jgi:hypothetical protein